MRLKHLFLFLSLTLLITIMPLPTQAQNERVITLGLSEFMRSVPIDEILGEFEAQNPGIRVQPVYISFEDSFVPPAADDIEAHLEAVKKLAQAADVGQVSSMILTPEATRAGYLLDLSPLASADASLDPADFPDAVWDSYRWDNGLWALPAKVEPLMMVYDPAAFDAAGLAYPTGSWTLDDLANAARKLSEYDATGGITRPGLIFYDNQALLLRSLYGQSLNDASGLPDLDTPELQALVEAWSDVIEEGIAASSPGQAAIDWIPPMSINRSFGLFTMPFNGEPGTEGTQTDAAALPGGIIGMEVNGFGVSSGTAYPQEAYLLAKFLTESPEMLNLVDGMRTARNSLADMEKGPIELIGGMTLLSTPLSPELTAKVEDLLSVAVPVSEMRFSDALTRAVDAVIEDTDSLTALQDAELMVITSLQTASDVGGNSPVIVATPVPEVVLAPGEIELRFSAGFTAQTGEWERLLSEFTAADSEVGLVTLDPALGGNISMYAQQNDCFYLNYNAVPSADLSLLLSLDPFMSADADFASSDVAGNALAQMQRDNRTWGFPLVINPMMLHYYPDLFAKAGVPEPSGGWTASAFVEALEALREVIPAEQMPFTNRGFGDTHLLILIAAYGGLPLDFRTSPPTINFTDPAAVEATRQVLDLAKNGLLDYQQLGGNSFRSIAVDSANPVPLYSDIVAGAGVMRIGGPDGDESAPQYDITGYPSGTLTATAYEIGAGYISATTEHADPCYRLFKFLSQHPELFDGMPALRSQFSNPALLATVGQNAADFYTQYDAVMQDPDVIVIPSSFTGGTSVTGMNIIRRWLDTAFDQYVLEDADLLTALEDAQLKAETFQTCVNALTPYDPVSPDAYLNGIADCVQSVDPDAAAFFPRR